jgi:hypothetical protein
MIRPGRPPLPKNRPRPALSWGERLARWRLWGGGLLFAAAVGAAGVGVVALEPRAKALSSGPVRLEWVNLPMWLSDPAQAAFLRQRERDAALNEQDTIHDPSLCRTVGERLAASPWIASVKRVQAVADGRLRVEAAFRTPVAMVSFAGMAYLVDRDGVRLPLQAPADQVDRRDWLVIAGVRAGVPQVGQPWPGDDLAAGLKLVTFLLNEQVAGRMSFRPLLRGVDVSNVGLRRDRSAGELQLVLSNPRAQVHWGLPPMEEYGTERPAASKIQVLNELFASQTLQSAQREIDIRDRTRVLTRSPR